MKESTFLKIKILTWIMGFIAIALLIFGIIRELFLKSTTS
jgi:hypothetical protein